MLADGVFHAAAGDSLRREARVDGSVVLTQGRPLVPRLGVHGPPQWPDGTAGVRPASILSRSNSVPLRTHGAPHAIPRHYRAPDVGACPPGMIPLSARC